MEPTRQARAGTPWWRGRGLVIGVPYAWLVVFFLVPFLVVLKISFSEMGTVSVNDVLSVKEGVIQLTLRGTCLLYTSPSPRD